MSIELSRDANRLIEDIELELASIRAAMALRPLEQPHQAIPAATIPEHSPASAIRQIGPFDLTRSGGDASPAAPAPDASAPAAERDEQPKRMTLQERLASLRDDD